MITIWTQENWKTLASGSSLCFLHFSRVRKCSSCLITVLIVCSICKFSTNKIIFFRKLGLVLLVKIVTSQPLRSLKTYSDKRESVYVRILCLLAEELNIRAKIKQPSSVFSSCPSDVKRTAVFAGCLSVCM